MVHHHQLYFLLFIIISSTSFFCFPILLSLAVVLWQHRCIPKTERAQIRNEKNNKKNPQVLEANTYDGKKVCERARNKLATGPLFHFFFLPANISQVTIVTMVPWEGEQDTASGSALWAVPSVWLVFESLVYTFH